MFHPLRFATSLGLLESSQWRLNEALALLSLELTSKPPWLLLTFFPFLFGFRFGLGFEIVYLTGFHVPAILSLQRFVLIPLVILKLASTFLYAHNSKSCSWITCTWPNHTQVSLLIYKPIHKPILTLWLILTPMGET